MANLLGGGSKPATQPTAPPLPPLPSYESLFGGGQNPQYGPQSVPFGPQSVPFGPRPVGSAAPPVGQNTHQAVAARHAAKGKGGRKGAGGGGGGDAAPAGVGSAAGGATTTTQISPYLLKQIGRYEDRLSSDTTQRAIDRSNLGIADAAALLGADAKANLASRGILNSGAGAAYVNKRITQPALRQAAGAAADISLGRERDLDNLVLGGTGLMTAPDSIALENQRLALAQQGQATDQAFRAQQANSQNEMDRMNMLLSLYGSLLGSYPGGF